MNNGHCVKRSCRWKWNLGQLRSWTCLLGWRIVQNIHSVFLANNFYTSWNIFCQSIFKGQLHFRLSKLGFKPTVRKGWHFTIMTQQYWLFRQICKLYIYSMTSGLTYMGAMCTSGNRSVRFLMRRLVLDTSSIVCSHTQTKSPFFDKPSPFSCC